MNSTPARRRAASADREGQARLHAPGKDGPRRVRPVRTRRAPCRTGVAGSGPTRRHFRAGSIATRLSFRFRDFAGDPPLADTSGIELDGERGVLFGCAASSGRFSSPRRGGLRRSGPAASPRPSVPSSAAGAPDWRAAIRPGRASPARSRRLSRASPPTRPGPGVSRRLRVEPGQVCVQEIELRAERDGCLHRLQGRVGLSGGDLGLARRTRTERCPGSSPRAGRAAAPPRRHPAADEGLGAFELVEQDDPVLGVDPRSAPGARAREIARFRSDSASSAEATEGADRALAWFSENDLLEPPRVLTARGKEIVGFPGSFSRS